MQHAYQLTITLEESLHTGTGESFGEIDQRCRRDRHNRPMVAATTLKGIWREQVAAQSGEDVAKQMFGAEGASQAGCVQLTSAYLDPNPASNPSPYFHCSTRVAIDRETGRSAEDMLAVTEYMRAGLVLHCLVLTHPKAQAALEAVLGQTGRLGAQTSIGFGKVRYAWQELNSETQVHQQSTATPPAQLTGLQLIFRNIDPLLLSPSANSSNHLRTETYIRGNALLGAFTQLALQAENPDLDLADCLGKGSIHFGHAYPIAEDLISLSQPIHVLPAPRQLLRQKTSATNSNTGTPHWFNADTIPHTSTSVSKPYGARIDAQAYRNQFEPITDAQQQQRWKRLSEHDYIAFDGTDWCCYQPLIYENSARNNLKQHQLFTQQQLCEDQFFVSTIYFDCPRQTEHLTKVMQWLMQLDQRYITLGRGKTVTQIHQVRPIVMGTVLPNSNTDDHGSVDTTKTHLELTFASDVILRDPSSLQTSDQLKLTTLLAACGWSLEDAQRDAKFIDILQAVEASGLVGGYNFKTALPALTYSCIKHGSAYRLGVSTHTCDTEYAAQVMSKLLAQLQQRKAIGEQVHLGYGRFLLNTEWISSNSDHSSLAEAKISATPATSLSLTAQRLFALQKQPALVQLSKNKLNLIFEYAEIAQDLKQFKTLLWLDFEQVDTLVEQLRITPLNCSPVAQPALEWQQQQEYIMLTLRWLLLTQAQPAHAQQIVQTLEQIQTAFAPEGCE